MKRNKAIAVAVVIFALIVLPLAYVWFTAPADPIYNGKRLSTLLYQTYGGPPGIGSFGTTIPVSECNEALKHLGPKAAPLLIAWIENRPSPLRDKLRDFLRRKKVNWPYLTADHQDIIERLFFTAPKAAVPLAEAFQWQILNGQRKDALKAAVLFAFVINSTDPASKRDIAARNGKLVTGLLDQLETRGEDLYSLSLVGLVLRNYPEHATAEVRERVLRLSAKSRYLDSAVDYLKNNPPKGS